MKSIKTVSIGIPAYNEAKNIKKLLQSLLLQKEDGFLLKEIIVISDGSKDATAQKVNEVHDKRITLLDDRKRLGKSARLDQIFRRFNADILILMDADIVIKDKELLKKTVKDMTVKKNGITGVNALPLPATTVFERILEAGVMVTKDLTRQWNNGNNYLSFKGCFLALDGRLVKTIHMPSNIINNDAYLYFVAIQKGFSSAYLESCSVFYHSPLTFTDHIKQSSRYQSSRGELENYFDLDWESAYKIPPMIIVRTIIKNMIKNPFYLSAYIGVNLLSKLKKQINIKSTWSIASSTKGRAL